MPEPRAFKPLREFGEIPLGDRSFLKFYVDEFKGRRYGSIRAFVSGEAYSGPTKSGITLNARLLADVVAALEKLDPGARETADRELARWTKKPGVELVARVTLFKDTVGVDLREWVAEAAYSGWSKKGARIPIKELSTALGYLRRMRALVAPPQQSGTGAGLEDLV
jgi:hypothetical protein